METGIYTLNDHPDKIHRGDSSDPSKTDLGSYDHNRFHRIQQKNREQHPNEIYLKIEGGQLGIDGAPGGPGATKAAAGGRGRGRSDGPDGVKLIAREDLGLLSLLLLLLDAASSSGGGAVDLMVFLGVEEVEELVSRRR